jgi:hypothetical protein
MHLVDIAPSIESIPCRDWDQLASGRGPDHRHGYLRFREHLEPGAAVAVSVRRAGELVAATHGTWTTEDTAQFSHPWKLLTDDLLLRVTAGPDRAEAEERKADLITAIAGDAPGEAWRRLSEAVGPALMIRNYDHSGVLTHPDLPEPGRLEAVAELLRALQATVIGAGGGAVVFPFVTAEDGLLRTALREAGFRSGVVTAASTFDLRGLSDYPQYLASLTSDVRRQYRKDAAEFASDGLDLSTVPLRPNADRIARLEAQTIAKHGGRSDPHRLSRARVRLADLMPEAVRVSAARRDGEIVACAIQLVADGVCCALAYGCDYSFRERSIGYHHLLFGEVMAHCIGAKVHTYKVAFEAFNPKRLRGARIRRRETWLWLPDQRYLTRMADLLRFLTDHNVHYLTRFGSE